MMELVAVLLALGLFAGMLGLLETGYRLARKYKLARGEEATGLFDTAIFALLGLLLAFAFSGAIERMNMRRDLIVEEANALSNVEQRIVLLGPAQQQPMRDLYTAYVGKRLEVYHIVDRGGDPGPMFAELARLQDEMWGMAVAGVSEPSRQFAAEIVLPAVSDMINVTTKRKVALGTHLSWLVLGLLSGLSLLSAFLAGAGMARHEDRHLVHGAIYAAAVAMTIYTILDLDNPRGGLISNAVAERALLDVVEGR